VRDLFPIPRRASNQWTLGYVEIDVFLLFLTRFLRELRAERNIFAKEFSSSSPSISDPFMEVFLVHVVVSNSYLLLKGDANAMKAGSHEMKGMEIVLLMDPKIYSPLMTTIDYKGFQLTAVALCLIEKDSLFYGSSDAGKIPFASFQ